MPIPTCRTVQEAYDAGRADALAEPAGPEVAARLEELIGPWLQQATAHRPKLLTVVLAADQLGVSKVKFYELMNSGAITTVLLPTPGGARDKRRVGETGAKASRRVEQAEVDAFIERNRQPAEVAI